MDAIINPKMIQKWWKSYINWYVSYSNFKELNKKKGLDYFRDKLFISILLLTFLIGILSYMPSGYVAVTRGDWFVLVADTIAVLVLTFIVLNKRIDFETKKTIFSINLYLLSFALLLHLGFKGNGSILIFTTTGLITLYKGRKAGINSVLISVVLYVILIAAFYFKFFHLPIFNEYDFDVFAVVTVNNVLFNFILVFSISFLIEQLHNALIKENLLQQELVVKHNNAVAAKLRAEKSDQLKSAFLTNVSHEIGTPMYGILGCTDFLKEYNKEDKEYQEYVELINNNGNKLLDIISDIVNISKVETGLMLVEASTFNVTEVIDIVHNTLLPTAKEKGIVFTKNNLISTTEAIIYSDKEKLTEVLKHLLKNAIKYTEKGTIDFRCFYKDQNTIEFLIKDSGIGIPKDKFNAIFKAFYQVDVDHKNALHGSGIGLTIAKAYTEMLGGKLTLENNAEIGATFRFTINTYLKNT